MGNEKYNPYDYNRYFNLPKPAPELLTPRAGMSRAELEHMHELKRRAEEAGRREYWISEDLRLHRSGRDALLGSQAWELAAGIRDCRNDPDR